MFTAAPGTDLYLFEYLKQGLAVTLHMRYRAMAFPLCLLDAFSENRGKFLTFAEHVPCSLVFFLPQCSPDLFMRLMQTGNAFQRLTLLCFSHSDSISFPGSISA